VTPGGMRFGRWRDVMCDGKSDAIGRFRDAGGIRCGKAMGSKYNCTQRVLRRRPAPEYRCDELVRSLGLFEDPPNDRGL